MLDITRLGHGDNSSVVADVQDAVLLEDGSKHALDNHGWSRVADEAGFFVELLGEEVDTKVAVLAGLSRGADADDLAGATLKDQQVTNSDVMAWNGDGVGRSTGAWAFDVADALTRSWGGGRGSHDLFTVVVMAATVNWMKNAVGSTLYSAAEAVVVSIIVVVTHVALRGIDGLFGFDVYVLCWGLTSVLNVVGVSESLTVIALSDVDFGIPVRTFLFDVKVDLGAANWFSVSAGREGQPCSAGGIVRRLGI